MCDVHYRRWRLTGSAQWDKPVRRSPRPRGDFDVERDVIAHLVRDSAGCLVWPFATFPDGRGKVNTGQGSQQVHRIVYVHLNGPVPEDLQVNHRCGRGSNGCADPRHLYAGTQAQNIEDTRRHGTPIGRRRSLDDQQVAEIRRRLAAGESSASIARDYPVSKGTIDNVRTRRYY